MCKNPLSPYLVGMSKTQKQAVVIKSDCDSWECEECAKKKQSRWVARAILGCQSIRSNGTEPQFVTITSHEKLPDFAATAAVFPNAWAKLYARMKRRCPELHYLLITEQHKSGRLHAHFLTDLTEKKRWWKNNARSCGLGFEADVQKVESDGMAAAYVSKYIGKSLGGKSLPAHFRRVRCSQNWEPLADLGGQSDDFDWLVCSTTTSLWACVEQCQAEKRSMVDGHTGEYFDYGDAIDTWYH